MLDWLEPLSVLHTGQQAARAEACAEPAHHPSSSCQAQGRTSMMRADCSTLWLCPFPSATILCHGYCSCWPSGLTEGAASPGAPCPGCLPPHPLAGCVPERPSPLVSCSALAAPSEAETLVYHVTVCRAHLYKRSASHNLSKEAWGCLKVATLPRLSKAAIVSSSCCGAISGSLPSSLIA